MYSLTEMKLNQTYLDEYAEVMWLTLSQSLHVKVQLDWTSACHIVLDLRFHREVPQEADTER